MKAEHSGNRGALTCQMEIGRRMFVIASSAHYLIHRTTGVLPQITPLTKPTDILMGALP